MPRVFISTAETSADIHAAGLVRSLRALVPDLRVNAAGGTALARSGARLVVDMHGKSAMGFATVMTKLGFYVRAMRRILTTLQQERHDALILVDAPSFNLRIARKVRRVLPNLPILYYIAPKAWAWKEWRVKALRTDTDRVLCIFPFEEKFFRDRGVNAVFAGNPTMDQIRSIDPLPLRRQLALPAADGRPANGLLAVFPGSRGSEVRYIWPAMARALDIIHARCPGLHFAIAAAPSWNKARLSRYAPVPDYAPCIENHSQELLAVADAVLAKSGTTTLEAALLGRPMTVVYKGDWLSWAIASRVVRLPYVSLPNILAGHTIVQELLQHDATPQNMADETCALLMDPARYAQAQANLLALRQTLGDVPAADRAAKIVYDYIKQ